MQNTGKIQIWIVQNSSLRCNLMQETNQYLYKEFETNCSIYVNLAIVREQFGEKVQIILVLEYFYKKK